MKKEDSIVDGIVDAAGDMIEGAGEVIKAGLSGGITAVHETVVDSVVDFVGDALESRELLIDVDLKNLVDSDLLQKVTDWASARNITKGSNAKDQYLKLMSEFGELAMAARSANAAEFVDGIGDCLVVLTIISSQLDIKPEEAIYLRVIDSDLLYSKENQFLLLAEELGNLSDAISKNDRPRQEDHLGGSIIILASMAEVKGWNIVHCLTAAYNDIKDRKGVMYNGVFVKANDSRYEGIMAELNGGL